MAQRRKKKTAPTVKKECNVCKKSYVETNYYRVDSPLFPDGRINTCRYCIKEQIDTDNVEEVINFLRQIDKPFFSHVWESSLKNKRSSYPIGTYLAKLNALSQYKGKTFKNSDGINNDNGDIDMSSVRELNVIRDNKGNEIVYSNELVDKWDVGYNKKEYLKLEKYYVDMMNTHDIHGPAHTDQLMQLAYLTVERDKLRQAREWTKYKTITDTYEKVLASAGFKPSDRKGIDESTGMKSFAQIWEEVEKRGFRKPPVDEYNEDIYDGMIVALANYYHRLIGKEIISEIPEELREDMDKYYEDDLTPEDIDDFDDLEDLEDDIDV